MLNIAGSKYMPGAAYLSSVAALKIGCGYCFLASCDEVIKAVSAQTQNIVFVPLNEIKKQKPDVLEIGCGITTGAKKLFITAIKTFCNIPVVIDADGLNILSKLDIKLPQKTVLTPHPKEASRLLNIPLDAILNDTEYYAKEITKKYNCTTVLKTHNTVVCSKNYEIYINNTGNSALAKAGSGDVLTGMIAGLLAQGMSEFEASKAAVYLHGLVAELASAKLTEYSVMAKDVIDFIPNALAKYV